MEAAPHPQITNATRIQFLLKLDKSQLMVSDWEAAFIESFLQGNQSENWFSKGRMLSVDKMIMKYGREPEIKMPHPDWDKPAGSSAVIPESKPGCCMYLVQDEDTRRRVPCNAPAQWMRNGRFLYCQTHAEHVRAECEQFKRTFTVVRYVADGGQAV